MWEKIKKQFSSSEDVISMFIGLGIVLIVGGIIIALVQKGKGNISLPGVSDYLKVEEIKKSEIEEQKNKESTADTFTVESGDNLWKIAVKVYGDGYKWTEIAKANNLKNPSLIYRGQKLNIPKIAVESESVVTEKGGQKVEASEYTVVRGDSLWKIAVKEYKDGYKWTKIWQDNRDKLRNPNELEIGMKLFLYGKI